MTPTPDSRALPDESTRPATWMLFCESRRKWSAAVRFCLRRASRNRLAERVVAVEAAPPLATLASAGCPVVLALEFDCQNLANRLGLLAEARLLPDCCPIGLAADAGLGREAEPTLLEAGAKLVITSPRQAGLVVALHDCHAERRLATAQPPTLQEEAWRRLPWQPAPWAIR